MITAGFERHYPTTVTFGRHHLDRNHGHHIVDTGGFDSLLLARGLRTES